MLVRGNLENLGLISPASIGFFVAIMSAFNGASMTYVPLQFIMFALLVPLLFLIKYGDRFAASVLLATFLKIYFISQVACVFLLRAPDVGLNNPTLTTLCMIVGLASGMLGIGVAMFVSRPVTGRKPILFFDPPRISYRSVAYPAAVIGILSQIVATFFTARLTSAQHGGLGGSVSGVVLFSYLAPLSLLSMSCLAAHNLTVSKSQRLFSKDLLVVIGLYLAAIAPLASKTEPLNPIVALAVVAVMFRWRVRAGPMIAGVIGILVVAQVLYPVVNYARLRAFGQERSVAAVFLETTGSLIVDPGQLESIRSFSQDYERTIGQNYFGRSLGFIDRFTPLRTDQIISAAQYSVPVGPKVFGEAAVSILPQTLGFRRDTTGVQSRIEQAFLRKRSELGKVNWENTGFVADGYFSGGFTMVAAFMFLFGFIGSLAGRITFGAMGGGVIWVPFLCEFMLFPAGLAFAGAPPQFFWGWVILAAGIYGVITYGNRFFGRVSFGRRPQAAR